MNEQSELDTLFDEFYPTGTVVPKDSNDDGKAEIMTKMLAYRRDRFKQALTELIERKVKEARLMELNNYLNDAVAHPPSYVKKRIARLKKELNNE